MKYYRLHACMHTHIHTHAHTRTHTHAHTHTHKHTHTHAHTHTHTHTHKCSSLELHPPEGILPLITMDGVPVCMPLPLTLHNHIHSSLYSDEWMWLCRHAPSTHHRVRPHPLTTMDRTCPTHPPPWIEQPCPLACPIHTPRVRPHSPTTMDRTCPTHPLPWI